MPMSQHVQARMCAEVASRARFSVLFIALCCFVSVANCVTGMEKNAAREASRGTQNARGELARCSRAHEESLRGIAVFF